MKGKEMGHANDLWKDYLTGCRPHALTARDQRRLSQVRRTIVKNMN